MKKNIIIFLKKIKFLKKFKYFITNKDKKLSLSFHNHVSELLRSFDSTLSNDKEKILSIEIQKEIQKYFNINLDEVKKDFNVNLFDDLKNDGILQIKNYFNKNNINKINSELGDKWFPGHYFNKNKQKKSLALSQIIKQNLRYAYLGYEAYLNNESIQKILLDKNIIQICEKYFGFIPTLYSLNLVYTSAFEEKKIENATIANLHRDPDDRFFLTFFIPIEANKEDEAHYYIRKTHNFEKMIEHIKKNNLFKNIQDKENFYLKTYLWDNNRNTDNLELETIFKELRKTLFVETGDLLVEDGRGLHSGPKINKNRRIMLWIRYGSPINLISNTELNNKKFKYKRIITKKERFILRNFYI
jgi:hypothetical protein